MRIPGSTAISGQSCKTILAEYCYWILDRYRNVNDVQYIRSIDNGHPTNIAKQYGANIRLASITDIRYDFRYVYRQY